MRLYFSGGSPIAESYLKRPDIMLSYYCHTTYINETKPSKRKKKKSKTAPKPNSRMRNLMSLRQEIKFKKKGK